MQKRSELNMQFRQLPREILKKKKKKKSQYHRSQGLHPGKPEYHQAFFLQLHKLYLQICNSCCNKFISGAATLGNFVHLVARKLRGKL